MDEPPRPDVITHTRTWTLTGRGANSVLLMGQDVIDETEIQSGFRQAHPT